MTSGYAASRVSCTKESRGDSRNVAQRGEQPPETVRRAGVGAPSPSLAGSAAKVRSVRLLPLLAAVPTLALGKDGEVPDPISVGPALLFYAVLPLVITVVVIGLVMAPSLLRAPRYRPSSGYEAAPLWVGGPPDAMHAVERADATTQAQGGASGSW